MNLSVFSSVLDAITPRKYEVFYTLNGKLFRVVGIILSVVLYDEMEPDIERLILHTDIDPWVDIEMSCVQQIKEIE